MQDDILIFRTSITKKQDMERIETLFAQYPQIHKWNVDFDDWEKVLRIESRGITSTDVSDALQAICIYATELELYSISEIVLQDLIINFYMQKVVSRNAF